MANNINPISINTQALKYAQLKQTEKKQESVDDASTGAKNSAGAQKEVSADDVLNYMAAQNVDIQATKAKKVLDVSKYATPEQIERIAGFDQGFESSVQKGLLDFDKEFPNSGLSDSAKTDLVVEMFNKNNL